MFHLNWTHHHLLLCTELKLEFWLRATLHYYQSFIKMHFSTPIWCWCLLSNNFLLQIETFTSDSARSRQCFISVLVFECRVFKLLQWLTTLSGFAYQLTTKLNRLWFLCETERVHWRFDVALVPLFPFECNVHIHLCILLALF